MEYYNYIKALHLIFVITWFAGLFYIPRLFIYHIEANTKPRKIKVKEIGKPMKIENNMAANMSIPIIGFEILTSPSKVDNQSPKGNTSG